MTISSSEGRAGVALRKQRPWSLVRVQPDSQNRKVFYVA